MGVVHALIFALQIIAHGLGSYKIHHLIMGSFSPCFLAVATASS